MGRRSLRRRLLCQQIEKRVRSNLTCQTCVNACCVASCNDRFFLCHQQTFFCLFCLMFRVLMFYGDAGRKVHIGLLPVSLRFLRVADFMDEPFSWPRKSSKHKSRPAVTGFKLWRWKQRHFYYQLSLDILRSWHTWIPFRLPSTTVKLSNW